MIHRNTLQRHGPSKVCVLNHIPACLEYQARVASNCETFQTYNETPCPYMHAGEEWKEV